MAGVGLICGSAALFGSGPFFARVAYDAGMTALPILTWRFVFAALVAWLLLLGTDSGRRSLSSLDRRRVLILVGLGVLYVGNAGSFTAALATVPVPLVSIIAFLYPALVAVLSVRFVRRLEGRRAWFALGISTLGVALAVGGIPEGDDVPLTGLLLAFTCPIVYAIWIILAARLGGERPTPSPAGDDLVFAPMEAETVPTGPGVIPSSAVMTTATALGAATLTLLVGGSVSPADVPDGAWLAVMGFGACSALAFRWFLAGTRRIGAARAALLSTVEPVYTVTLATILLGEALSPIQMTGGALVIAGVILAELRPAGAATEISAPGYREGARSG